ncbi:hypothetical protein ACFFX0_10720 [Citricoccus parietis]|uniref:Uncharacterized protein n=1 Tax=Citricoccus parietis TaxID=592307 RepID=A0ABV5FY79_9MICC
MRRPPLRNGLQSAWRPLAAGGPQSARPLPPAAYCPCFRAAHVSAPATPSTASPRAFW